MTRPNMSPKRAKTGRARPLFIETDWDRSRRALCGRFFRDKRNPRLWDLL